MTSTTISTRQKEMLQMLLLSDKPISYKDFSEQFKLSKRTIQREISSVKPLLDAYHLRIGKRMGIGIELKGSREGLELLKSELVQKKALSVYTPQERQEGLAYDLLLHKEPIKQYVFSDKYGVTEATISHDLDKVSKWIEKWHMELYRTPGVGIYIEGTEHQRRTALSRLLHKNVTFEEWLELFQSKVEELEHSQFKLGAFIQNRLLKFVHTPNILIVEHVVREIIYKEHTKVNLTDRNYVNLVVHLMLAVERIKHGEIIEKRIFPNGYKQDRSIKKIAEKIVNRLEKTLSIAIPKVEEDYIVLHLIGARISNEQQVAANSEYDWFELVYSFVRAVEVNLEETFIGDEILIEGLVAHFVPAFHRLKFQLQIHNPMLEKIKTKYPDVYSACKEATEYLTKKTGYLIPEDEIGYLAMHIGAARIRTKQTMHAEYSVLVVCASGLGTSTYLASQIGNEMPNLKIKAIVSVNEVQGWLERNDQVQLLISTVHLPFAENIKTVNVTPFLSKEDIVSIQKALASSKQQTRISEKKDVGNVSMMSAAKYGEAMVQIMRNYRFFENVEINNNILNILTYLETEKIIVDLGQVQKDIEKREKLGGFILDQLAMLHAKTDGITELCVTIFRMKGPFFWHTDNEKQEPIQTFLLLLAPKEAPKEHIEMISEISATLIDETFFHTLVYGETDKLKAELETLLSRSYAGKAKSILKG